MLHIFHLDPKKPNKIRHTGFKPGSLQGCSEKKTAKERVDVPLQLDWLVVCQPTSSNECGLRWSVTDGAPDSWLTQMLSCSKGGCIHSWYKEVSVISFAKKKVQRMVKQNQPRKETKLMKEEEEDIRESRNGQ